MIVGTYFDGDNDDALKWQQHDRYREALGIIAYGCLEQYKKAAITCGAYDFKLTDQITAVRRDGFDHRTLQAAHDYLAAWWRWKHDRRDSYFEGLEPVTVDNWLLWLGHEVEAWPIRAPHTIQLVVRVLLNQNTDGRYAAEDVLQEELKRHYTGMPANQNYSNAPRHIQELLDESIAEKKEAESHVISSIKKRRILPTNAVETGGLIICYLGLSSAFSLFIIGISNQYQFADFFMLCRMVILGFIGIFLFGMTCLFLWCKGEDLISTQKDGLVLLGHCIKGIVIIIGIILMILFANHMPYDPDCPAGAARYC